MIPLTLDASVVNPRPHPIVLATGQEVRDLHQRMRVEGVRMSKRLFEAEDLVSFSCADPDGYAMEIYG